MRDNSRMTRQQVKQKTHKTALVSRLEKVMEEKGWTARGWSLAATGQADTIRNILRERSNAPRMDTLQQLAEEAGCTVDWLTGREDAEAPEAEGSAAPAKPNEEKFTAVGRFDVSFSMGPGALIAEHPEPMGYWMIETQWLRTITRSMPQQLAIVRAAGDSMLPTLQGEDWVLIDMSQRRITREGIYAIRVGDDVWIKRLSLNLATKAVRVISDNPTTPVQEVDEDALNVVGRVISIIARKM